jgi:hypothetical protein
MDDFISISLIARKYFAKSTGKYCGIFAPSKNCGARETDIASERLWNNSRLWATAPKLTTERRPLLGIGSVSSFPRQRIRMQQRNGAFYVACREIL